MEDKTSILIVDDDLYMTDTLYDILREIGYNVAKVNDGYKAIEIFTKFNFDIILMDIRMPGINGVETFKAIKSIKPSVKVVIMTAYSMEDFMNEALKEGIHGIIFKPFKINKLINYIENIKNEIFILILDDNPTFYKKIRKILEEMQNKIFLEYDSRQVINRVTYFNTDLIRIDVKIHVMNDLKKFLVIKNNNPNIVAVIISGGQYEDDVLMKKIIKNDLYINIYNPIEKEKFIALIGKFFEKCINPREKPLIGV